MDLVSMASRSAQHNLLPSPAQPDPTSRMFIMTILAFIWSGAFAAYLGSIIYFGISLAAHIGLILMFFFTIAIFYDAERSQSSWLLKLRSDHR